MASIQPSDHDFRNRLLGEFLKFLECWMDGDAEGVRESYLSLKGDGVTLDIAATPTPWQRLAPELNELLRHEGDSNA